MPTPSIDAPPATLRAIALTDAADLFPAFSDAANMTYWSSPPQTDVAQTEADIAWWLHHHANTAWAILDADGKIAGRTGLMVLREGVAEAAVMLRKDASGKGLAVAAINAICEHGFSALGLHRIFADIDPENHRSRRLFEACGFLQEATLRHNWRTHLGLRDTVIYARFPA
jgi:[ribosomal protein S5]-alanine N-acetyltransferase